MNCGGEEPAVRLCYALEPQPPIWPSSLLNGEDVEDNIPSCNLTVVVETVYYIGILAVLL